MMGISAKITLEGLTGRDLRDRITTDYQKNESYQATEEGLFTRVTLMLQQYVCVELNLLGWKEIGVLQRIMSMFDQEEKICGYQVEIIFSDFMTRVSETLPIATISENLQQVNRGDIQNTL
ncbi:hypothetical protein N7537_009986 [Penicillium hordei]|uniref:Uncharacterized protein n=1 Tax=Penicillium hordei TaxID=40994 RepID=A0AAD6DVB1_9EURO|nr:uncharacterized protein N7537_009986 [Penicillium hordei]KAJ5593082.1 hypothetical protein N7537_009986 [Penicillium hordei]